MIQRFHVIAKTRVDEMMSRYQAGKAGRSLLVILLSALALALQSGYAASPVAAASLGSYTFMVNSTNDTHDAHPGDGVCADQNGQCSVRAAIEEADALPAGSSVTIGVPVGTYALSGSTGYRTLALKRNTISIVGASNTTTIIEGNQAFTIMSISAGASVSLSQLTIEDGGGVLNNGDGGGIYNAGGRLVMSDSLLTGNVANYVGGGIYSTGGSLTVSESIISNNSANNSGGGIYAQGSTLKVSVSTISGNSANNDAGGIETHGGTLKVSGSNFSDNTSTNGNGGAIYTDQTALTVSYSAFDGNTAYFGYGGGIYSVNGALKVRGSVFSENAAGDGGGIYNESGTLKASQSEISASTINNNSAAGAGGGICLVHSWATVSDSTISGNSAATAGGGIESAYGTLTVSDSTISGNSANVFGVSRAGGIDNGGTLRVSNSTISGNLSVSGGGIFNDGSAMVNNSTISGNSARQYGSDIVSFFGPLTLTATIVANDKGDSNCAGNIKITDGGSNLDSGSSCGFTLSSDLSNTAPMLGHLQNNGGLTKTMALLPGSKAIDWVVLSRCSATDQRGDARPDGSGESACDIGTYESAYS